MQRKTSSRRPPVHRPAVPARKPAPPQVRAPKAAAKQVRRHQGR